MAKAPCCVHDTRDGSYDPCNHVKVPLPHPFIAVLFGFALLCGPRASTYTKVINELEKERTSTAYCEPSGFTPDIVPKFLETVGIVDIKLGPSGGQVYPARNRGRCKREFIATLATIEVKAINILFKDRGFRALAYANKETCAEEVGKPKEKMKGDPKEEYLCAFCKNPMLKRKPAQMKTITAPAGNTNTAKTAPKGSSKLNNMVMLEEVEREGVFTNIFLVNSSGKTLQLSCDELHPPLNNQLSTTAAAPARLGRAL